MVWGIVEDIVGGAQEITGTLLPIGSLTGSTGVEAAERASAAQQEATQLAIEEARAQREEETRRWEEQMAEYRRRQALSEQQQAQQLGLLSPYMTGGQGALYEMMALSGLSPVGAVAPGQGTTGITFPDKSLAGGLAGGSVSPGRVTAGGGPLDFYTPQPGSLLPGGNTMQIQPVGGPIMLSQAASTPIDAYGTVGPTPSLTTQAASTPTMSTQSTGYRELIGPMGETIKIPIEGQTPTTGGGGGLGGIGDIMEPIADVGQQIVDRARAMPQEYASQFTEIPSAVNPYAGMTGAQSQAAAIEGISQSPLLAELTRQGEEAILQQAAATGGLRGGNVQGALAQYRPQMLQQEIDRQYARLSGLSGLGQQSILGFPTSGALGLPGTMGTDTTISSLLQQLGAQQAGSILSGAQMQQGALSDLLGLGGTVLGLL